MWRFMRASRVTISSELSHSLSLCVIIDSHVPASICKCRLSVENLSVLTRRFRRTFSDTLRKTKRVVKKHNNKKKPVLVVRRVIDYKGRLEKTEVDIKSFILCDVLQEIHKGVQGLKLTADPPVVRLSFFYKVLALM